MKIQEIDNKETWEGFLSECKEKTFLQAFNWGEFQKNLGNKIWRFGIFENGNLISLALIVKISAKRGTFLFCPHAPSVAKAKEGGSTSKYEILKTFRERLKKIAKNEGVSFIRIAPIWAKNEENIKVFKNLGFRDAPIHMHPEITWELNITPNEEKLLMQMRKTTRYLVRQAEKNKEIEISQGQTLEDIKVFHQLYQETVNRHHFTPFSLDYLEKEFLAFNKDNQILIFSGKYKDEVLASAIIIFWQNIAFYHHGASAQKYSKIPVSYLLQREAIKEAKERGCNTYNFWGIAPVNSEFKRHPWAGLTLFKMGFGGYRKEYVRTQDLPLSSKYWLNYIVEKIRRSKRGL